MPLVENPELYIFLVVFVLVFYFQPTVYDYDEDGEPTVEPKTHVKYIRIFFLAMILATVITYLAIIIFPNQFPHIKLDEYGNVL